jgi:hypothetical protein
MILTKACPHGVQYYVHETATDIVPKVQQWMDGAVTSTLYHRFLLPTELLSFTNH